MMLGAHFLSKLNQAEHDPALCRTLLDRLSATLGDTPLRFMEVCGTHTVSIFQSGIRSLLPSNITHLSGPGCPVCVTHESEIAMLLELAKQQDVILATFGDLLRVPGPDGQALKHARTKGATIEVIYSPLDAVALARKYPDREVVFAGIGFETTAPTVAAAIIQAQRDNIRNLSILSMHKLVMPALRTILNAPNQIDGFLLPGHVATVIGIGPFIPLATEFAKPAVVAGFDPADILLALCGLAEMRARGEASVDNAYARAVASDGNPAARKAMDEIFTVRDSLWRGLGLIKNSGLAIKDAQFDAAQKFGLAAPAVQTPSACKCGAILQGRLAPPQCPLFAKACTPASPIGPCMVSTEGSCAAWYKYGEY